MTIPARSKRQAMDWSLVLVSQGIEAWIEQEPETGAWALIVASEDYENALSAIRQYLIENRGWPWQRHVFRTRLVFDWGCLAWVGLLLLFFALDAERGLRTVGLMDPPAILHGQWWRLLTGIWLHADVAHLAANATFGVILLGLAMGRFGTGTGLLAAYLCGAAGNILACALAPERAPGLGASGMVMGCLGLLAGQSFSLWQRTPHASKFIFGGLFAGLMLFVFLGLSPGTDVVAHLGGFLSGVLLSLLLTLKPGLTHGNSANVICGALFSLLVIIPWWLALR